MIDRKLDTAKDKFIFNRFSTNKILSDKNTNLFEFANFHSIQDIRSFTRGKY